MRIAVLGAGAMGSMLGAFLKAGGADVTLIVRRKELAERLKSPGLTMKRYNDASAEKAEPVPMDASVGTDGLPVMDAVLITVKGPDTKAALESAAGIIGENTKIITLQNGLGNPEIIAEKYPKENIFYGCLNMSAIMEAPGVLTCSLFEGTNIFLGAMVKGDAQAAFGRGLCDIFTKGGAPAEYTEDIDKEVWNKLLMNIAVNASCGLVRLRGGEAGEDQQFVLLAVDMVKEAIAVAKKLGVELDFGYFMGKVMPAARKTSGKHYPSMAQDMMIARTKTEIDFMNGAIERLGEQVGVPTPVNTTVSRLVRVIENNYDRQYMPKSAASGPSYKIKINDSFCKGCGYCIKYCPKGVLALGEKAGKKGYKTAEVKSVRDCVGCLSCSTVCPEAAITVSKED